MEDSVQFIKGVGEKRAKTFEKLGIKTVSDLLYHLPRDYEDRSDIKNICDLIDGEKVCVLGRITASPRSFKSKNRLMVTQATISDGTGIMKITWFNARYIEGQLQGDREFVFFGEVTYRGRNAEMVNPVVESYGGGKKTGRIVPIYPLRAGISQYMLRSAIEEAIKNLEDKIENTVPEGIAKKCALLDTEEAMREIHFPSDFDSFKKAKYSLAFEELLVMQTGIQILKGDREKYTAEAFSDVKCIGEFAKSLPFELTNAQKRVINEICADLKKNVPMNRLVQGDVGSGKTVVAAAAMLSAVRSGFQGTMIAPTEILAKQHYKSFTKMFENMGVRVALLIGGKSKEKTETLEKIARGEIDVIVGTHAVLTDKVSFKNLALAVTDEQHRFGVKQRAALAGKGKNVHTLVMTATPIPRTLSLILYGDLDVSVIDELPPGRKEVKTFALGENMRERINKFIASKISEGRQIYIVCPLVEESELMTAKAAVEYAENLRNGYFKNYSIDVLHGKMKAKEKDAVMEKFANGETDILVSTTVIEVGVDVPNASVMVIENAERFGLSQLHQLRGRIRRGKHEAFCIMFCKSNGEIARERMKIMQETNDGFKISEKDLYLRGPGEFFGVRQHGLPELKIANLSEDMEILKMAQMAAEEIIGNDKTLSLPENQNLKKRVMRKYEEVGGRGILS
ncbi:MAG: ATP-dependent DNA helicase RecG [Clostridia bacterium]|nr:ATP-dependent DNA helicase RecG [Clostridia bacterium]